MEWVLYALSMLIGGLVSHLLFSSGPGPFERTIWMGLSKGERVSVSIGDEAFIFTLNGNRLRIERGTSTFTEAEDAPVVSGGDTESDGNFDVSG